MTKFYGGLLFLIGLQAGCSSSSSPASTGPMDATAPDVNVGDDILEDSGNDSGGMKPGDGAVPDAMVADAAVAWTPSSIPGLVLWLDAHTGLGLSDGGVDGGDAGPPLFWADQSGHGNNATGNGSPIINPTALGGQPAVHFNGTTDYLLVSDSTSLQWGTGDWVLAIVAQHTTPLDAGPGYGTLYSKQIATTSPYDGVGLFANLPKGTTSLYAQLAAIPSAETSSGTGGFNSGSPFVVIVHRASVASDAGSPQDAGSPDGGDAAAPAALASLALAINGTDAGSNTGPGYARDVSAVGFAARIGGTQYGQDLMGDIAEVIGIEGPVSDADIAKLHGYLQFKYGL